MIENVTLLPCENKNIPNECIVSVLDILSSVCKAVYVDQAFPTEIISAYPVIKARDDDGVFDESQLIIVMGGDGSIIDAARRSASYAIPILGINFGRLGFLAELEVRETELLMDILKGNFKTEKRMMLDVTVTRNGEAINIPYPCLNDVVLSNGPVPRLSSFDLYCDGARAARYSADGIIISTPTGSSAYSMSAGGPLIYQTMECICATPICPHSFTLRPVIFTADSVIEIRNALCRQNKMYITVDGKDHTEIFSGDTVTVKRSRDVARLVRVKEGGLIGVLSRKLSDMDSSSV